MSKPSVYSFKSSVSFLNAYLDYLSATDRDFSLKKLADYCDFKYQRLIDILKNKTPMKLGYVNNFKAILELDDDECFYLQVLVKNDLAKSDTEKRMYSLLLTSLNQSEPVDLSYQKSHGLYQNHLCMTILSMLKFNDLALTVKQIQAKLIYDSDSQEVSEALKTLRKSGLIAFKNGLIRRVFDSVRTENDSHVEHVSHYYEDVSRLAIKAISEDLSKREFQCFSFGLSQKDMPLVKSILRDTRNRLANLEREQADHVYQVNLQAFPVASSGAELRESDEQLQI